jgi:DNA polymerase-3 subunit alpha
MQEICRRLKPKELEDLAALNALYRPGPLDGGMVDDFIARHRGDKKVTYIVPQMKDILMNTYGILVYQEQIMQLAQNLAGYSLGEADMMRRAMGKKKREEMAIHEEKFVKGAVERNIPKDKAEQVFNLMKQFADYGFNRSHSVAYAYLAFQTAYLKAHYPAYFYASVLSNEADDTAKIYKYTSELKTLGVQLLPPDVNESDKGFTPLDNAVRFGLEAIKGIGASSVEAIIEARKQGKFTSLFDFTTRIEQGAVNKRALESLITAGAFDSIKPENETVNIWRAKLYASIEISLSHAQKAWNDKIKGQNALFGFEEAGTDAFEPELPNVNAWTQEELAQHEKNAVGFYLSNHPLDDYNQILSDMKIPKIADFADVQVNEKISIAGIVSSFQVRHSKKGNRFCIFRIEDQTNGVKCLAWADTYTKFADTLKDDELLIVSGKVEANDQEITLIIDDVQKLLDAVPSKANRVEISIPFENLFEKNLDEIVGLLNKTMGKCDVYLNVNLEDKVSVGIVSQPIRVLGSKKLENDLISKGCQVVWHL